MIRPLRQRHRRVVIALILLLPIGFAGALTVRDAPPAYPPAAASEPLIDRELGIRGHVGPGGLVTLDWPAAATTPDTLVYWSSAGQLERARLLGRLEGRGPASYRIPPAATGSILLYSPAQGRLIWSGRLAELPGAPS